MRAVEDAISKHDIEEIAIRFFEQHYSILNVKEIVLEDGIWTATVLISSFGDRSRRVRIDAKSGMIIDWYK